MGIIDEAKALASKIKSKYQQVAPKVQQAVSNWKDKPSNTIVKTWVDKPANELWNNTMNSIKAEYKREAPYINNMTKEKLAIPELPQWEKTFPQAFSKLREFKVPVSVGPMQKPWYEAKVPVGNFIADVVNPPENILAIKEKIAQGQSLTPQEKRGAQDYSNTFMLGVALDSSSRIAKTLTKNIVDDPTQPARQAAIAKNVQKEIATKRLAGELPPVNERLKSLLTYQDKLQRRGFSPKELDSISFRDAQEILEKKITPDTWRGNSFIRDLEREQRGLSYPKDVEVSETIGFYGKKPPIANEFTDQDKANAIVNNILSEEELGSKFRPVREFQRYVNSILAPIKNAPPEIQNMFDSWRKGTVVARNDADRLAQAFTDIPAEDGWKMMRYIENPTPSSARNLSFDPTPYTKQISTIRKVFDTMREKGIKQGLDVGYLDNYLNHIWLESPQEIAVKVRGLSGKPGFVNERVIPSYSQGVSYGLTPKYTHPAQLVAHYRFQLEKAIANKNLADELVHSGTLIPTSQAPYDWKPITAPLFPRSSTVVGDNKIIKEAYSAPEYIADSIDSIFGYTKGGAIEFLAKTSRLMQDITLSGGVGPLNSFTLGNMVKDITAGRIKSPVSSFVRSWSKGATDDFFTKNQKYVHMMAEEGLQIRTEQSYQKMYDNILTSHTLKDKFGKAWSKYIDAPTFQRFMPQLETNLFSDTYDTAIAKGLESKAARSLAAETTKNFYGLVDNFSRPKATENALSAIFFAPRYREAMITFWKKNVESVLPKNLTNPAFATNRKFLVGTVITYGLYNELNKKLAGHSMSENKPGKEAFLEIPREDGRSWFIPMLPSVGTLPRRAVEIAGALKGGDTGLATQKAGSMLSQPLNLLFQVGSNETFYGGPIYGKYDSASEKFKKLAGYSVEQSAHPLLGEPIAYAQGRKTGIEAFMGLLELPVYPSASSNTVTIPDAQLKRNISKAFISGDKKDLADAMNETRLNSTDPSGVASEGLRLAMADAVKNKDEATFNRLSIIAQQVGVTPDQVQTTLRGQEYKKADKDKLRLQMVEAIEKGNQSKFNELLTQAKSMGITPESVKDLLALRARQKAQ